MISPSPPRPYSPTLEKAADALGLHYAHADLFESPGKEKFVGFIEDEEHYVAPESYVKNRNKRSQRRTAVVTVESICSDCSDAVIPYLAMTYFDRFLSRRQAKIPTKENEDLFAICCVTLAWKLRTTGFELQFFLEEKELLKDYQVQNVVDMELLICKGLNWRMHTLTPFSFIGFYIPFLQCPQNVAVPSRLVHNLIIRSQCDIAFTEIRPSVLAACAVIIVSSKVLTPQHDFFELKITTDIEPLRLQRNMVLKCIKMLGPLYMNPPICEPRYFPINPRAKAVHQLPNPRPEAASSQATGESYSEYEVDCVLMDFELGWDEWLTEREMGDGPFQRPWISRLTCCLTSPSVQESDAKTSRVAKQRTCPTLNIHVPPVVNNKDDTDEALKAEVSRENKGSSEEEFQCAQEGNEGGERNERPVEQDDQGAKPRRLNLLLCATFIPRFSDITLIIEEFSRIGEIILVCTNKAMRTINLNPGIVRTYKDLDGWSAHEESRSLSQELIEWADALIVCPLSAHTLTKIALGLCNNLVTTIIKEYPNPYIVVPDMLETAWSSASNKDCFNLLKELQITFWGHHSRQLANVDQHAGPMTREYSTLAEQLASYISEGNRAD